MENLLSYADQRFVQDSTVIDLKGLIGQFVTDPGLNLAERVQLEFETEDELWQIAGNSNGFLQAIRAVVENASLAMVTKRAC